MTLRWPWPRAAAAERLVVCSEPDRFTYLCCDREGRVTRCGVEARGRDTQPDFVRRLKALGLPAQGACALLPLAASQLLQIEAPNVKPEELKAAARWRVKDEVAGRLEDLTLDVMVVGPDEPRPNRHLFVAAARNETIRETAARLQGAGMALAVVDIAETAQRNLQTELAAAAGLAGRATAALVRHGDVALLTISAGGELYDARRLDWDATPPPAPAAAPAARPEPALATLAFDDADFVDYGATPDDHPDPAAPAADTPRLVVELQRSFDLWERSWPDLPLAALWVDAGDDTDALLALLAGTLGQRVGRFDPAEVFPGWARAAATPALRQAALPLAGALLRAETRRL
jgi:MSHA biogenesis protein MshI